MIMSPSTPKHAQIDAAPPAEIKSPAPDKSTTDKADTKNSESPAPEAGDNKPSKKTEVAKKSSVKRLPKPAVKKHATATAKTVKPSKPPAAKAKGDWNALRSLH